MLKAKRIVVGLLAGLLMAAPVAFADDAKGSGTVIAVDEEAESFTIKGSDGKTYEVDAASVVAEDLKTGDMVEYDLVEAKPVKVQKKK